MILDIDGVFNNLKTESITEGFSALDIEAIVCECIVTRIENRIIASKIGNSSTRMLATTEHHKASSITNIVVNCNK